ncbi:MAG TPA: glycosyltransferase [Rubrobacteraceae bacterium]|nr:glycosyltransferase [Rubrobacteraceae bacterium]
MNKPPVILLSGIRWDFLWQRHQILATAFARAGYRTVYVETTGLSNPRFDLATLRKVFARLRRSGAQGGGVRSAEKNLVENLTVYSPLVAPPTAKVFRLMNRRVFAPRVVRDLRALVGGERPVVIAYLPTQTTLDILSGLEPRLVCYDCSDNYEGFPGVPEDMARTERELLDRADVVSCTSQFLLRKVRARRPDAFLSGPGVDYERFRVLQGDGLVEKVRTACFFGHISEERIDFSILRAVAGAGFKTRLVGGLGRVEEGVLESAGIEHVGEVSHAALPGALAGTDAFIIPYRISQLTRGISPAKIYECFATGKPVVASPLPELRELAEHVYLADGPEEFVSVLRRLPELETEEKVKARVDLARQNSWEARFQEIEAALWRTLSGGSRSV